MSATHMVHGALKGIGRRRKRRSRSRRSRRRTATIAIAWKCEWLSESCNRVMETILSPTEMIWLIGIWGSCSWQRKGIRLGRRERERNRREETQWEEKERRVRVGVGGAAERQWQMWDTRVTRWRNEGQRGGCHPGGSAWGAKLAFDGKYHATEIV